MKLTTLGLPFVLGTFLAAVAYSASQPCDGYIPMCPEPGENNEEVACDSSGGVYEFGDVDDYDYYHCNGRDAHCDASDLTPGKCNVWVKTAVKARTLECIPNGPSGMCATEVYASIALNLRCAGGGCDPGKPTDSLPTDRIPPYPGLPSANAGPIEVPVL